MRCQALPLLSLFTLAAASKGPAFPHPMTLTPIDIPDQLLTTARDAAPQDQNTTAHWEPMIVGGAPAKPAGDLGWVAALVTKSNGRYFQFCGGTLVNSRFVITAAHCVEAGYKMDVLVGRYDLSQTGGELIEVEEAIAHPSYNSGTMSGDIAILRLKKPASIQGVPLITETLANRVNEGDMVTVLGWGLTGERNREGGSTVTVAASGSNTLLSVDLEVVTNEKCNQAFDVATGSTPILDEQVCAGPEEGGQDSCQGDSGGPLMAYINGKQYLFGVVSWGIGCARPHLFGVYTRVSYHLGWLEGKMTLETSLLSDKVKPGNLIITGTDKTGSLPITFTNLGGNTLKIDLDVSPANTGFSVDPATVSLDATAPNGVSTLSFSSKQATTAQAALAVTAGKAISLSYAIRAMTLPPADFGERFGSGWYSGGQSSWSLEPVSGNIVSGRIKNNENSCALYYFDGPAELSFSWTVGSEQNFDVLTFFLDNVPKAAISGNPGWAVQTATVGGGTHAAAWCYMKDKSMAEREDRGTLGSVAVRSLTRFNQVEHQALV